MRQFPKTQIRTLQFDSFFIENVKKVQDTKKGNLDPNEAYWLYHSENKLHEFVKRATLDTKIAILSKLDVYYSITVYDENEGADRIKWMEQFSAARGLESAEEWRQAYTHFSHSFIIGGLEVRRILSALEVMNHSKLTPISRYIKRLHNYKRLQQYDELLRQNDFIYFLFTIAVAYGRLSANNNAYGLDKKELAILITLYLKHIPMSMEEIKPLVEMITPSYGMTQALTKMVKQGVIDKTSHPYNRGKDKESKKFKYLINTEGNSIIHQVALKMLSYL
jgi:predicted transcriptional regulator